MNKKGEEENHWGTYTGVVLILIALLGFLIINSDTFAPLKKGFEKIADKEAIEKAYKKTIGREEALTEEEKKTIDQFNLFFKNNFIIDDDDCIKQINFDEIKGKGFGIGVRNGNVFAEKEERARVYPLIAPFRLLAMYFDEDAEKIADDFFIDENFEKVNNKFELENIVYVKNNKIYLLDEFRRAILQGVFSDIAKKDFCGAKVSEKISITNTEIRDVPGTTTEEAQDVVDYLNSEIEYLGTDYKIYEILKYLFDLNVQRRGDFPIEEEINFLLDKLGNHIENYFGEDYRGLPVPSENACWKAGADFGYAEDILLYGKSPGDNLLYRKVTLGLSDGEAFNFVMSVSRYGCLPAVEIDKLLEQYRNVGAPGQ